MRGKGEKVRAEPIGTGFGTMGNGVFRPDTPNSQAGQGAENPRRYWFFTLGSMGKNSFAASGTGGLGTRSPFRGACRNCHNPRHYGTEGGGLRKTLGADSREIAAPHPPPSRYSQRLRGGYPIVRYYENTD